MGARRCDKVAAMMVVDGLAHPLNRVFCVQL